MALGGTYRAGTVTIAVDRITVTGGGTFWSPIVEKGDWLYVNGQVDIIATVVSDTQLTLETGWPAGTLPTAATYMIVKNSWLRYDPALTQAKVRELLEMIEAEGTFLFVEGDEPDPAMGEDGQWALKTDVSPWQLWHKEGGAWIPQATPAGMEWRGAWNTTTAYNIGDGVEHEGSSYIAIAPSGPPGWQEPPGTAWDLMAAQGQQGTPGGGREFLTAARTYYVRTDGSDSNNGLTNSSGGAFLTIQRAVDITKTLDLRGFAVTIQVGPGTYTGGATFSGPFVGAGSVVLIGDQVTPANCVISTTSIQAVRAFYDARIEVYGFKLQTTTAGACLYALFGGVITCNNLEFGQSAGDHMEAADQGFIGAPNFANFKISGGAAAGHWHAHNGNISVSNSTITFVGTPHFAGYFVGCAIGSVSCAGNTFVNAAGVTGRKFFCHWLGELFTGTNDLNYLPGNVAGDLVEGGFYNGVANVGRADVLGVSAATLAPAGYVGETTSSIVVLGSAVSLVSATAKTVTSITLPPGNYDVWVCAGFTGNPATVVTLMFASITTTDNGLDLNVGRCASQIMQGQTPFVQQNIYFNVGPTPITLAASTTLYFTVYAAFSTSTMAAFGGIYARRRY